MSVASELMESHRSVFERAEFRWERTDARIRIALQETGESWSAVAEGERLVLRHVRPGDPPPHLTATMTSADFEQHLAGECDLLTSREEIDLAFATGSMGLEHSKEELMLLFGRVLSALALSLQCSGRFRGTVIEELYLANRSLREDGGFEPMGEWSLPYYAGEILYDLVTSKKLQRTLEVGMAHALSTLFIAQGHHDNGGGQHIAIDPWQNTGFSRCGVESLRRAGLDGYVQVLEEPNYVALPGLLSTGAESFQLVFIDGLHIFDHVLLDFFHADLLLEVGGYVVFDDSDVAAVKSALSFIAENRYDSYEAVPSLSAGRITVLKKTAGDVRVDKYGVTFHRHFDSGVPELAPMPPPASPRFVKHAVDRVSALLALILLMPVGLVVALAVLLEDLLTGKGVSLPFQREPRVSAGKRFNLITFRTSRSGAGPQGPSGVGALLRRFHLDGLPMLWNILRGRMSFVGPLPISPHDHTRLKLFSDCEMRAGLTGIQRLAKASPESHGNEYYHEYVGRNQLSLLAFDLRIMLKTLVGA